MTKILFNRENEFPFIDVISPSFLCQLMIRLNMYSDGTRKQRRTVKMLFQPFHRRTTAKRRLQEKRNEEEEEDGENKSRRKFFL